MIGLPLLAKAAPVVQAAIGAITQPAPVPRTAHEIDKEYMYGNHDEADATQNRDYHRFGMKAAYKALDMRMDEDMNIYAPRPTNIHNSGIGAWGMAGIIFAMLLALGLGLLAAWVLLKPTPHVARDAFERITEELQPDGSWKEINREPVKP